MRNKSTKKVLFYRRFRRQSGGQFKLRDYFYHCLAHPRLQPFIYFTPDSRLYKSNMWDDIPKECLVTGLHLNDYEILFLEGKDWKYLPENLNGHSVINLIQHVRHGDPENPRFPFLKRNAYRICASRQILEAIAPHMNGPARVIEYGIPSQLFLHNNDKKTRDILILALKNPELGKKLHEALAERGVETNLLLKPVSRQEFARALLDSAIFVGLPNKTEGFYLPALEAMLSRCAVVCSDAIGNRDFCIHEHTALMPAYDNFDAHMEMIDRLLTDSQLKQTLCQRSHALAQRYTLEAERRRFYEFLEQFVLK